VTDEEAKDAIAAVSFDDRDSLDALGVLAFSEGGISAAKDALEQEPQGATLWAAVYVYASGGTDPAPLKPYLTEDTDPSVRLLAAGGTLAMGDKAGVEPLIALLASGDRLAGSRPPMFIWEVAVINLQTLTTEDLGPPPDADDTARATAQQAWRDWFAAHGDGLTFGETGWTEE
jgi:hypothetical protein